MGRLLVHQTVLGYDPELQVTEHRRVVQRASLDASRSSHAVHCR